MAGSGLTGWLQRCRESRQLVLVIVAIALLLDNMLLTTVGELFFFFRHIDDLEHFQQINWSNYITCFEMAPSICRYKTLKAFTQPFCPTIFVSLSRIFRVFKTPRSFNENPMRIPYCSSCSHLLCPYDIRLKYHGG